MCINMGKNVGTVVFPNAICILNALPNRFISSILVVVPLTFAKRHPCSPPLPVESSRSKLPLGDLHKLNVTMRRMRKMHILCILSHVTNDHFRIYTEPNANSIANKNMTFLCPNPCWRRIWLVANCQVCWYWVVGSSWGGDKPTYTVYGYLVYLLMYM